MGVVPCEGYVQRIVGALLDGKRLSPHRRAIISVIELRARQIWTFALWFSHFSPIYTCNSRVHTQPAFQAYERLLSAQTRDLVKLGAVEVMHINPADEFAQAVVDAQEAPGDDKE